MQNLVELAKQYLARKSAKTANVTLRTEEVVDHDRDKLIDACKNSGVNVLCEDKDAKDKVKEPMNRTVNREAKLDGAKPDSSDTFSKAEEEEEEMENDIVDLKKIEDEIVASREEDEQKSMRKLNQSDKERAKPKEENVPCVSCLHRAITRSLPEPDDMIELYRKAKEKINVRSIKQEIGLKARKKRDINRKMVRVVRSDEEEKF